MAEFLKYKLRAETLCFGERIRGGLFRPCAKFFRYSTLIGALKSQFGNADNIHAIGRFVQGNHEANNLKIFSFAPHDRTINISTIPLEIEYLSNVNAEIYIFKNDFTASWPKNFTLSMGAMKSKGFGRCNFEYIEDIACDKPQPGCLAVRIPEDEFVKEAFGIRKIVSPIYGYLFRPTSDSSGVYVRSLFEGSQIVAYDILLRR